MKKRLFGILALVLFLSSVSLAGPYVVIKIGPTSGMTNQVSCGAHGC